ncbi:MAG: hypothetical protein M1814_000967 [Vezdaea aestivalis]|nr:MAG: hypothetical protein M1814_000967 [Vezdaea aestivalis]
MASTFPNREKFINSLVRYLQKYGLDGVDIDWEYPVASDRGGTPEDKSNFVQLLREVHDRFANVDPGWELTLTLPSSYWYLRGFDLNRMQDYVSWFNLLSYDIHGLWDKHIKATGPLLRGHTNTSEIEDGLDLLWKNGVKPSNVVMGFAFYGRSFTIKSNDCTTPGCEFSTAGSPGDCTNEAGVLSYTEITSRNHTLNLIETHYDAQSTVKYIVYNGNQWISYDDAESFLDKKKFLSTRCLSGLMVWAIDQDTLDYQALTGLLGDEALRGSLLQGGDLDDYEKSKLSSQFGAYTGQNCYVTPKCTDGTSSARGSDQICKGGFTSIETAHNPLQNSAIDNYDSHCPTGSYHHICCPTQALPRNCKWNGAPERSAFGCDGKCGADQFRLNTDTSIDAPGKAECGTGKRFLCCDSTEVLQDCAWEPCQTIGVSQAAKCPDGKVLAALRKDDESGTLCNAENLSASRSAFCCPKDSYQNCHWAGDALGPVGGYDPEKICRSNSCPSTQVKVSSSENPVLSFIYSTENSGNIIDCAKSFPPKEGYDPAQPLCCDPPNSYNHKWPVDPSYLWANPSKEDDEWQYADNFGNNDKDTLPSEAYGDDPYGFVMLDGPKGAIAQGFSNDFTVVTPNKNPPKIKRSILTTNQTIIDSTFDHVEETIHVYCKYREEHHCRDIFIGGAKDTIIRLHDSIGEGPFGRVLSMEPDHFFDLPQHHIQSRDVQGLSSNVFKLTFDYNFHLIKRDDDKTVNLRVDYTNLLPYWKTVTDSPAKRKRDGLGPDGPQAWSGGYENWLSTVESAAEHQNNVRKKISKASKKQRRWFGPFDQWLAKLTSVKTTDVGDLPMTLEKSLLIYKARVGCSQSTIQAGLDINADTKITMNARYAYYLSGSLIPPKIVDTYAYIGVQPSAYLGIRINGNAQLRYESDRRKLVDTLTYPGLAIKGIAAVGPSFDLYGQLRGNVRIAGSMQIGALLNFEPTEAYWPDNDLSEKVTKFRDTVGSLKGSTNIEPHFDASVAAEADFDVIVTPEVNFGLKIGGGIGKLQGTLMDAQIVGFVNNTLRFHIDAQAATSTSGASAKLKYGVYLIYNLGMGGYANFANGIYSWAVKSRLLFPESKQYPLYENQVSTSTTKGGKRSFVPRWSKVNERGLLNPHDGDGIFEIGEARSLQSESPVLRNWSQKISPVASLGKRDVVDTFASFAQGLIQCPDSSDGKCLYDSPKLKRSNHLDRRVPGILPCKTPSLVYNCLFFPSLNVRGYQATGICDNVRNFYNAIGLPNDLELTWDNANQDARRADACPGRGANYGFDPAAGFCATTNDMFAMFTGVQSPRLPFSCDEVPMASSEQGGTYYRARKAECVPAYQQTLQGNCHRKFQQWEPENYIFGLD